MCLRWRVIFCRFTVTGLKGLSSAAVDPGLCFSLFGEKPLRGVHQPERREQTRTFSRVERKLKKERVRDGGVGVWSQSFSQSFHGTEPSADEAERAEGLGPAEEGRRRRSVFLGSTAKNSPIITTRHHSLTPEVDEGNLDREAL